MRSRRVCCVVWARRDHCLISEISMTMGRRLREARLTWLLTGGAGHRARHQLENVSTEPRLPGFGPVIRMRIGMAATCRLRPGPRPGTARECSAVRVTSQPLSTTAGCARRTTIAVHRRLGSGRPPLRPVRLPIGPVVMSVAAEAMWLRTSSVMPRRKHRSSSQTGGSRLDRPTGGPKFLQVPRGATSGNGSSGSSKGCRATPPVAAWTQAGPAAPSRVLLKHHMTRKSQCTGRSRQVRRWAQRQVGRRTTSPAGVPLLHSGRPGMATTPGSRIARTCRWKWTASVVGSTGTSRTCQCIRAPRGQRRTGCPRGLRICGGSWAATPVAHREIRRVRRKRSIASSCSFSAPCSSDLPHNCTS
mmetsp:Transcript_44988/g.118868  ORF Transcript_44988/g.118868 Transcript_44988/m.118868 type:complete len:360 (+) Transcript_44988:445-1524(+)